MAFVWGVLQEIDQTMFGISLDVTFPLTFGGPNQATTFFACLLHACVGKQCDPKNGARKSSSCCSVATHTEVHSHFKTSQPTYWSQSNKPSTFNRLRVFCWDSKSEFRIFFQNCSLL